MPRYFFHLRSEELWLEDLDGVDLPHLHAALAEVMRARGELAVDPGDRQNLAFEVTDSSGRILFKVPVQQGSRSLPLAQGEDPPGQQHHRPDDGCHSRRAT